MRDGNRDGKEGELGERTDRRKGTLDELGRDAHDETGGEEGEKERRVVEVPGGGGGTAGGMRAEAKKYGCEGRREGGRGGKEWRKTAD